MRIVVANALSSHWGSLSAQDRAFRVLRSLSHRACLLNDRTSEAHMTY